MCHRKPPHPHSSGGSLPVFIAKRVDPSDLYAYEEKGTPTTASSCDSFSPTTPLDQVPPPYAAKQSMDRSEPPSPRIADQCHFHDDPMSPRLERAISRIDDTNHFVELPLTPRSTRRGAADDRSSFAESIRVHLDHITTQASSLPTEPPLFFNGRPHSDIPATIPVVHYHRPFSPSRADTPTNLPPTFHGQLTWTTRTSSDHRHRISAPRYFLSSYCSPHVP